MFAKDSLRWPRPCACLDLAPSAELVSSVGNNLLTFGKPGLYRCVIALGYPQLDCSHLGRIVRFDHINVRALRPSLDSNGRYQYLGFLYIHEKTGVNELIREQRILFVVEYCFKPRSTCSRIDLVIEREQAASGDLGLAATVISLDRQMLACSELGKDVLQVVFRDGKKHRDRLNLRDH